MLRRAAALPAKLCLQINAYALWPCAVVAAAAQFIGHAGPALQTKGSGKYHTLIDEYFIFIDYIRASPSYTSCVLHIKGKAMLETKNRLSRTAWAFGFATLSIAAQAAYPDKQVKIVVAFPPGSSTDTVARLMAQQMTVAFGQTVVVENRPGASGNIATTFVSKQPGDGYTLLMHSVAVAVNPSLYAKAGYDVNKDLEAVAITGVSPNIFFVHPDVKAKTLAELVALSKKEKLSYASSGNGTTTHLGAEIFFRNLVKSDIQHVPYAPATAVTAVLSGQVPVGSTSVPPVVQLAKSGKVRALAVTSLKRSIALPDVPTMVELGYKDFEANTWFALFAPPGTPVDVLDKLNSEINKIALYKSVQEVFSAQSLESARMDRTEVKKYILLESQKWDKVVKQIGAKVD